MLLSLNFSPSSGCIAVSYCVLVGFYLIMKAVKQIFIFFNNFYIIFHELSFQGSEPFSHWIFFCLLTDSKVSCGHEVSGRYISLFFFPKRWFACLLSRSYLLRYRFLHFNKVQIIIFK